MYTRAAEVIFEVVDEHAVLVDGAGKELITLNQTGTIVWQALDGRRDVSALAVVVVAAFDGVVHEDVKDDVCTFLRELVELGLVVESDARG